MPSHLLLPPLPIRSPTHPSYCTAPLPNDDDVPLPFTLYMDDPSEDFRKINIRLRNFNSAPPISPTNDDECRLSEKPYLLLFIRPYLACHTYRCCFRCSPSLTLTLIAHRLCHHPHPPPHLRYVGQIHTSSTSTFASLTRYADESNLTQPPHRMIESQGPTPPPQPEIRPSPLPPPARAALPQSASLPRLKPP